MTGVHCGEGGLAVSKIAAIARLCASLSPIQDATIRASSGSSKTNSCGPMCGHGLSLFLQVLWLSTVWLGLSMGFESHNHSFIRKVYQILVTHSIVRDLSFVSHDRIR